MLDVFFKTLNFSDNNINKERIILTICSLIVQTKPESILPVTDLLEKISGVEVQASDECGKMVVTIDHPDREYCSKTMTDMTHIDGVMSTSLVYEYQEDQDAL